MHQPNIITICSCYNDQSCIERVKTIQDFHQNDRGWVDIGYHFLVGENGKVYQGRGWNRQGAHSTGWNDDAYGKNFINYSLLTCSVKVFPLMFDSITLHHQVPNQSIFF